MSYAVFGAALPYVVGVAGFGVSVIDAYTELLPIAWKILYYETRSRLVMTVYSLYLLVPVAMVVGGLWPILYRRSQRRMEKVEQKGRLKQRQKSDGRHGSILAWYRASGKLRWFVQAVLVIGIAGAVAFLSFDRKQKIRFAVDYYAYHKMWPEVLTTGRKYRDNRFVMHCVDEALYHTGRLGNEMFRWPQDPAYLFMSGTGCKWSFWQSFDVNLDMGPINIAENALTECLEGLGDRPMILQRLALINMVKGNIGTARIYLGVLSKTLFHCDWADRYLERLDADPTLSTDEHVQHLRSIAMKKDYLTIGLSKERMLLWLLEENSNNRMAFEYLMAWFLLNKHLGKFVQNIERFKDFGYTELPRYYEEAALIYVYGTGKPLDLGGYRPREQLRQQIEDFSRILSRYGADKAAAFGELLKYRNTYFFYYMYAQPSKAE